MIVWRQLGFLETAQPLMSDLFLLSETQFPHQENTDVKYLSHRLVEI